MDPRVRITSAIKRFHRNDESNMMPNLSQPFSNTTNSTKTFKLHSHGPKTVICHGVHQTWCTSAIPSNSHRRNGNFLHGLWLPPTKHLAIVNRRSNMYGVYCFSFTVDLRFRHKFLDPCIWPWWRWFWITTSRRHHFIYGETSSWCRI